MTIETQAWSQEPIFHYKSSYLVFCVFLSLFCWLIWTKTEPIQRQTGVDTNHGSWAIHLAVTGIPGGRAAAATGIQKQSLPPPLPREAETSPACFQVKVVFAESGMVVPRATVVLRPDGRLSWVDRERLAAKVSDRRLYAQVLPDHDQCFSADEKGEVKIPLPPVPTFLFAISADNEYASLPLDLQVDPEKPERSFVLNLRPFRGLVVRVVDGEGMPQAGVPVGILRPAAGPKAGHPPEVLYANSSGADGEAVFPEANRIIYHTADQVAAGFAFPLPEPRRDLVPLAGLPSGALVTLVLPQIGHVAVELLDEQGAPLLVGASAVIMPEPGKIPPLSIMWFWRPRSREWFLRSAIQAVKGRVHFSHVGLGLKLRVLAFREGRPGMADCSFAGPQFMGQEVAIRLQFPGAPPVLTGRAMMMDKTPLGNIGLEVRLPELLSCNLRFGPIASIPCDFVRTNNNGVFRLFLPAEYGPNGARQILLATVPEKDGDSSLQAVLDLPVAVAEELRLGEVVFLAPRLLVAGIVVDQDGRPVPRATVHFDAREPGTVEGRWERILVKETDDEGRFSCSSTMPWEMVKVLVAKRGLIQGGFKVVPAGLGDLRIVLQGAGQIKGRILVAESLLGEPLPLVLCTLFRIGDDSEMLRIDPLDPEGGFGWGNLTPGIYRLGVRLNGTTVDLLTVDNIKVEAGKPVTDPRLERLDLRERLKPVVLTVLDVRGKPVNAAIKERASVPIGPGRIRLAIETENPPTLTLTAPGHQDTVVERLIKDRRVFMEKM